MSIQIEQIEDSSNYEFTIGPFTFLPYVDESQKDDIRQFLLGKKKHIALTPHVWLGPSYIIDVQLPELEGFIEYQSNKEHVEVMLKTLIGEKHDIEIKRCHLGGKLKTP